MDTYDDKNFLLNSQQARNLVSRRWIRDLLSICHDVARCDKRFQHLSDLFFRERLIRLATVISLKSAILSHYQALANAMRFL